MRLQAKNAKHRLQGRMAVRIWVLLLLFFAGRLNAQDHNWWADNVGWDGQTHWSRYIFSSTRFLGPNALPIPQQNDGLIAAENRLQGLLNLHSTEGDRTVNPRLFFDYVLVPERISFQLNMVPVEYFRMSHALKTERRVFHHFYEARRAVGDVLMHTNIQVLEASRHPLDARLRIGFRFASSSMHGAARFTDAPGYFFDMGLGRSFVRSRLEIRPSLMLGFYVWQTNRSDQFQDDAFLYGLACDLDWRAYHLHSSFRGYSGYFNDGDRPATLDVQLSRRLGQLQLTVGTGLGLWDNLYRRTELGMAYYFTAN